jgi:hypothetical protein
MPMPLTRAERVMKRAEIRNRLVTRAEVEAQCAARSLVCAENVRHDSCHGATVCLCECHDPAEVTT